MRQLPRGTKLQVEMVYDPLQEHQQRVFDQECGVQQDHSSTTLHWTFDTLTASFFEEPGARILLPFILPPLQQDFDPTKQSQIQYGQQLTSLCLSFDQRAEAAGITGYFSSSQPGLLTACDLSRYTIQLRLIQKIPRFYGGNTASTTPIYQLEIPGQEVFGNPFFFRNPLLIPDLNIQLQNNRTYYWEITVPGLYTATPLVNEQLAMPSFTLQATIRTPLLAEADDIQNLPTLVPNPVTLPLTIPSANAIIDGTTDVQTSMGTFDTFLQEKLQGGRGLGSGAQQAQGQEQALPELRSYLKDRGYTCIVVPMWQGYEDVRCGTVTSSALPGLTAPWTMPTLDRRVVRVPDGFVLHHAMAVQNLNSPPSPNTAGYTQYGDLPSSNNMVHQVGIAMHNGLRTEAFAYQQLAYCQWTRVTAPNFLVDELSIIGNLTNPSMRVLNIPLVYPAPGVNTSYTATGTPIFMGAGNDVTQARTDIGQMPPQFGGGALQPSTTEGAENLLELRWAMADVVDGLDNPLDPEGVLIGVGGHYVVLIGTVPVQ